MSVITPVAGFGAFSNGQERSSPPKYGIQHGHRHSAPLIMPRTSFESYLRSAGV